MQWMHIAIAKRCMDFRYAEEVDGDGSRLDFRVRPRPVFPSSVQTRPRQAKAKESMSELIHLQPAVSGLVVPFQPDSACEVVSISYAAGSLTIKVEASKALTEVVFPSVWGFRVLDELDLTEFWSQCSLKTGWLFEVTDGGWKALELQRVHFVSGRLYEDLREFLVIGVDDCVSVLSQDEPRLRTASS